MPRLSCLVQLLVIGLMMGALALSQEAAVVTRHISGAVPVDSARRQLSAERLKTQHGAIVQPGVAGLAAQGNTWNLLATLPGIIIHDISFPTDKIGYAVGELGQVWKTTDGGNSWVQQVLSGGESDYFYGVDAVTTKKVIISGFYDSQLQPTAFFAGLKTVVIRGVAT